MGEEGVPHILSADSRRSSRSLFIIADHLEMFSADSSHWGLTILMAVADCQGLSWRGLDK